MKELFVDKLQSKGPLQPEQTAAVISKVKVQVVAVREFEKVCLALRHACACHCVASAVHHAVAHTHVMLRAGLEQ